MKNADTVSTADIEEVIYWASMWAHAQKRKAERDEMIETVKAVEEYLKEEIRL